MEVHSDHPSQRHHDVDNSQHSMKICKRDMTRPMYEFYDHKHMSPQLLELNLQFTKVFKASVWGGSARLTHMIATHIGIALVTLPDQFGFPIKSSFANFNHLCRALIVVVAIFSVGEEVRALRFVKILLDMAVGILLRIMTKAATTLRSLLFQRARSLLL